MYGLHMDLQSSIMATHGFSDRFGCHELFCCSSVYAFSGAILHTASTSFWIDRFDDA